MEGLSVVDFALVPDGIRDVLLKVAQHFLTTKPVEDAFNRCRARESTVQNKQRCSTAVMWQTCVHEHVLSELHGYKEVLADDNVEQPGSTLHLPPTAFALRHKRAVGACKKLKGLPGAGKPDWTSPAAHSANSHLAGMCLLPRVVKDMGKPLDSASSMWRTSFLQSGNVVRGPGLTCWHLCCATLGNCLKVFWPLDSETIKGHSFFRLQPLQNAFSLKVLGMSSFADWKIVPARFISPLHLLALGHFLSGTGL